jgi:hypothetical protein
VFSTRDRDASGRPEGCCPSRPVSAGGTDQRAAMHVFSPPRLWRLAHSGRRFVGGPHGSSQVASLSCSGKKRTRNTARRLFQFRIPLGRERRTRDRGETWGFCGAILAEPIRCERVKNGRHPSPSVTRRRCVECPFRPFRPCILRYQAAVERQDVVWGVPKAGPVQTRPARA